MNIIGKIIIELIFGFLILGFGYAYWSSYKHNKYFKELLRNRDKILQIFKTEFNGIKYRVYKDDKYRTFETKIHRISSIKTPIFNEANLYLLYASIILALGLLMGIYYILILVFVFIIPVFIRMKEEDKISEDKNLVETVCFIFNFYINEPTRCRKFCYSDKYKQLENVFDVINMELKINPFYYKEFIFDNLISFSLFWENNYLHYVINFGSTSLENIKDQHISKDNVINIQLIDSNKYCIGTININYNDLYEAKDPNGPYASYSYYSNKKLDVGIFESIKGIHCESAFTNKQGVVYLNKEII